MNRFWLALVAIALAALAAPAVAAPDKQKIYKCKNASGETFYSQSYDPKQCGEGGSQLNSAGVQVRTIERQKTAEELAAEREAAATAADAARAVAEIKRQDDVLMQSYPTEKDLIAGHEQELRALDGVIRTQDMSAQSYESTLNQLLGNAAESERAGKPVPKPLAKRIDGVRADLEIQRQAIEKKQAERAATKGEFATRLARYRELKLRQEKQLRGE